MGVPSPPLHHLYLSSTPISTPNSTLCLANIADFQIYSGRTGGENESVCHPKGW